ncbi:hypothetical protein BH10PSE15_BH10PSE15_16630 [soil metagenome]
MRRFLYITLGVAGLASSTLAFGQTNSKASIIAAMKDSAPTGGDSDTIALPGVTQKAFTLGLPSAGVRPTGSASTMTRPLPTVRAPRAVGTRPAVNAAPGHAVAARPAYGRALDMHVAFDYNSANLTDSAKAEARQFAEALQSPELAGKRFIVAGHTDALGSRATNLDLSKRRAQSVVEFLVAQGANRAQLNPVGYVFDMPRSGTSPKDPGNRRVEFARAN